jgi:hypothetical protein
MIGQTQMEITARTQLQERGVSESEIKDRLLQKGISIEQLSADQALRIQPIIEQIVKELEAEHAQAKKAAIPSSTPTKGSAVSTSAPSEKATNVSSETSSDTLNREVKSEVRKLAAKSSQDIADNVKRGATIELRFTAQQRMQSHPIATCSVLATS